MNIKHIALSLATLLVCIFMCGCSTFENSTQAISQPYQNDVDASSSSQVQSMPNTSSETSSQTDKSELPSEFIIYDSPLDIPNLGITYGEYNFTIEFAGGGSFAAPSRFEFGGRAICNGEILVTQIFMTDLPEGETIFMWSVFSLNPNNPKFTVLPQETENNLITHVEGNILFFEDGYSFDMSDFEFGY